MCITHYIYNCVYLVIAVACYDKIPLGLNSHTVTEGIKLVK